MAFITATPRTLEAIRKADQIRPAMQKTSSNGSFMPNGGSLMPSSQRQAEITTTTGFELHGEFCPRLTDDENNFLIIENDLDTSSAQKYSYLYVPQGGYYDISPPMECIRKSFTKAYIESHGRNTLYVYLRVMYDRDLNAWNFIGGNWFYIWSTPLHTYDYTFYQQICMLHKASRSSPWKLYYSRFPGSIFVEGVWG